MKMSNQIAIEILEGMAIDMTGALGSLKKSEPIADVIVQRLDAINMAISALQGQITTVTTIDAVVATHRDELNALNNEELADWLCTHSSCHNCIGVSNCMDGLNGLFVWLQSPMEGGNEDA